MLRHREAKALLRNCLEGPSWREGAADVSRLGMGAVGPLLSFLPQGGRVKHRAARLLGEVVAALPSQEEGRNVVRRFMWHMNDESGNIGWGIPEAFGETLAASASLAGEFHRILVSYVVDTGRQDNFCDNAALRRSCFWAVGRMAEERLALCRGARPWIVKGLGDGDGGCRAMAAWTLSRFPLDPAAASALRKLAREEGDSTCELFDGDDVRERRVGDIVEEMLGEC
ncbi:MAG: HEAT repeat domain-containing protein [Desulfovibrio sp.]|jgi:hypothetical protein|nr:HEAT repeat domain-containing protein [Desulfovibrio sp.]